MSTYRWTGDGTFIDADRDFTATPGSEHDLTDEQADEYITHPLFGEGWKESDSSTDEGADEGTDGNADEDADTTETTSGGETNELETDETTVEGDTRDTAEDTDLEALSGVGPAKADDLRAAGYESINDLRAADENDLTAVTGISAGLAETITNEVD